MHGTGLMTEEYTPKNWRYLTAQNIIKIMIIFGLSSQLLLPLPLSNTSSFTSSSLSLHICLAAAPQLLQLCILPINKYM